MMDLLLFAVLPYVSAAALIGGLAWRYRYDQFGWTTRSSQLYESKLLKIGSPLFHYALFAVLVGHLVGLLIPKSWTDAVGLSQDMYHAGALYGGGLAGIALVVGLALLIYRRRLNARVFEATTWNDKLMYLILGVVILFGMWATLTGDHTPSGEHHNYRETVSVWFRSLLVLQPDVEAMSAATVQFKAHVVIALVLFAVLPFTRLIHAFTVPVHYLFRPYIVYRSRDMVPDQLPAGPRRGWDPVGTADKVRGRR